MEVSTPWKTMMPTIIAEELRRLWSKRGAAATTSSGDIGSHSIGGTSTGSNLLRLPEEEWDYRVRLVLDRSFKRIDGMARRTCTCRRRECMCMCSCSRFLGFNSGGSTAIVAILTSRRIVMANCGDSHAVLCRAGQAIPLSLDQKPGTIGELERIHAAGGKICSHNGVRVYGVLNMAHSLGTTITIYIYMIRQCMYNVYI